jgi:hypothetical protein
MEVKDYCRSVEFELIGWKAKMYDMVRKVDRLRGTDAQNIQINIEELHNNISDMERIIDKLRGVLFFLLENSSASVLPFSEATALCPLEAPGRSSCRTKNTPTPELFSCRMITSVDRFLKYGNE